MNEGRNVGGIHPVGERDNSLAKTEAAFGRLTLAYGELMKAYQFEVGKVQALMAFVAKLKSGEASIDEVTIGTAADGTSLTAAQAAAIAAAEYVLKDEGDTA